MYNNRYNNFNPKPYIAKNMLVRTAEIPVESQPTTEVPVEQQPITETPEESQPIAEIPPGVETGYIAVGVFTALGALPVENALVTVYDILENGEEHLHGKLTTDSSGRIPDIELPVVHNPLNPLESTKYYFTTYNLRAQANNYYTVNVLGIRIFPNIKTNYRIDMIPVVAGETGIAPEQTFIIPPSPIDRSNE